jgi:hypothetical protein
MCALCGFYCDPKLRLRTMGSAALLPANVSTRTAAFDSSTFTASAIPSGAEAQSENQDHDGVPGLAKYVARRGA